MPIHTKRQPQASGQAQTRQPTGIHVRFIANTGHLVTQPSIREPSEKEIRLRSEAEAPFRVLRLVFYGFFVISASIASLIATTQTIGALAGAPNAMPLQDTATSLAIDLGAAALFAFLFSRDKTAQDKQIARIAREEKLGALQLELANKRMLRMQQLRSFARPVRVFWFCTLVVAGQLSTR